MSSNADLFDKLAEDYVRRPGVSLGRMMSSRHVLSVNRKIFAMLVRDKLVVKLPKARANALVGSGAALAFEPSTGRSMKEWIVLEMPDKKQWQGLIREAFSYIDGS
ncbi:MAG TPA: hypothetical protein VHX59_00240 [Mycobacteriales bacterium]|nr:hypothetical protein [Mycobacteriales bacterium]